MIYTDISHGETAKLFLLFVTLLIYLRLSEATR
jgi:hypothetical protein